MICQKEKGHVYDPHAVTIILGNIVVGHVPQNICTFFWKFLSLPNTSIRARVPGKRINCGAGIGLEIPVCLVFQGMVKGVEWIKKKIHKAEKKVQPLFEKWIKMLFRTVFCSYCITTCINKLFVIEFYVSTCLLVYSKR